jgi:hypothetical protein
LRSRILAPLAGSDEHCLRTPSPVRQQQWLSAVMIDREFHFR